MNTKILPRVTAISSLVFALSVQAHDPKEHMKDADAPDCATMKNMDQNKMDINDPVTQAMMQKCLKGMHGMKGMPDNDETVHDTGHEDGESEGHTNDDGSTDNHH
tara:strand:- start:9190 stop:9504 length:315 start_codon:yes stop_codon:yes gene_type:complete